MNNVIFIHGEDSYSSRKHLKAIEKKYIQVQAGDLNLSTLEGSQISVKEFDQQIQTLPFLADKRLVILKNTLSSKNSTLIETLPEAIMSIPATTILVIYETKVDKRMSTYKKLIKETNVKEFPLFDEIKTKAWIKKEVINKQGRIDNEAVDLLYAWLGGDLWQINQELEKLITYNPTITLENVQLLTPSNTETIIFSLSDEIINGKRQESLLLLDNLRKQGEADLYIFSMILASYRNLLKICLAQKEGFSSPAQLKERLKLHPFVISKSLNIIHKTSPLELFKKYRLFLDIDVAIKTGTMEIQLALDLLITRLTIRI
jgi:DNA polymerase-3 subunit delta